MTLAVGQSTDIKISRRYAQHVRTHAIGDIYDALVELLTNADDSYGRLHAQGRRGTNGGEILIETQERRRGKSSLVVVRDRAEGMNDVDLERKIARMGEFSSGSGSRGYMGRGAKDCTELGDVVFESVKDNKYYRARIAHNLTFVFEAKGEAVTSRLREQLSIAAGNGTSVTIELRDARLPRLDTLAAELPWHYALRDMLSQDSKTSVTIRALGEKEGKRLLYYRPEGELVVDEGTPIDGYPEAKASLRIWRSDVALEDARPRFERAGIVVKGKRAIHECSFLTDEFRKDPKARHFFGRLICNHLDVLLEDYQSHLESGRHSPENPTLVIDPNRKAGLERRHPFVGALLARPIERLRALLEAERAKEKARQREVANKDTKNRLAKLARLAGRFLEEQLEDTEELSGGSEFDNKTFIKHGVLIFPTYAVIGVGKQRAMTLYVRRSSSRDIREVSLLCDAPDALRVLESSIRLRQHDKHEDRLIGTFHLEGAQVRENVVVTAAAPGLPVAEALVQVVPELPSQRPFRSTLEFECAEYRVRQGRSRVVHLFAKYPELVDRDIEAEISTSDGKKVAVKGRCKLVCVAGSNYAMGSVSIEGRILNSTAVLSAEVAGQVATATVRVVDKPEDRGVQIQFEIRDEDFGSSRSMWADREGKPNLLLISAQHDSVARYLGEAEQNYPGQNGPLFRALLAEIVAESVCRKSLGLESRERPFDFPWADLGQPHLIADDVAAQLHRRMRLFLGKAHEVMLSSRDLEVVNERLEARSPS